MSQEVVIYSDTSYFKDILCSSLSKIHFIKEIYWNLWNSYLLFLIWIKKLINYVLEVVFPVTVRVKLVFSLKKKQEKKTASF
jgi:hypothetical protein